MSRPLDPAQVGPVYLGVISQLLLRDLLVIPEASKVRRKTLAQVHDLANETAS